MKKNYFLILLTTIIFSSCSEEFLDRPPLDQQLSSTFYQTEEHAIQALVAVYDVLGYQSTPGISWCPFITISDILSDHSFAGGADANDGFNQEELNNFRAQTTNVIVRAFWSKNYTGIFRANLLLEKLAEIDAPEDVKARIEAECKFLRAHFYFEQVRFFENIPLLTQTLGGPSEYNQSQNTPKEVYDQIAKDLVEAIDVLPQQVSPSELGRITKWAAEGLLGRVYLFYKGVYNDELDAGGTRVDRTVALSYLEDLIQNSGHELMEDYSQIFQPVGEFSSESIFEITHGETPAWWDWGYVRGGEGNLAAQMQGPRVTGSDNWDRGWSYAPVNHSLFLAMENDPRLSSTILMEEELDGTLVKGYQHTGYYSKKYSSDAAHWSTNGQFELNRTCNQRVIRFSDVLLMAAELGSPNAQDYLDRVRARVGLPSIPATEENIYNERQLELALEGHRYFDVLRKGLDFASQTISQSGVRGPKYVGDQLLFDVQFNAATKGFLPIPQAEIDLSAGTLVQNAGY